MALALLLVGGGIAATALDGGGDGDGAPRQDGEGRALDRATTTVPSRAVDGEPRPIGAPPTSYEITYRVEGFAPDGAVVDVERRGVRLPFESRLETRPAEDPDGAVTFLQITGFGVLQTGSVASGPAAPVLATEPAVATGGAHVLDVGLLDWRNEERTIVGRTCQVFRTGAPMDVATLAEPDDEGWADLCVDDDGLVLQEEWVIDGDVFRRRTATEVVDDVDLADDAFATTGDRLTGQPGGSFGEVTADSRPPGVAQYELSAVPEGFTRTGRFAFSPPRGDDDQSQVSVPLVAMLLDVYEDRDGGLLVVATGGSTDRRATVEPPPEDEAVDLGPLGRGQVLPGLRQHEVRVALAAGRFVRVWGTLPVDDLVAITRTLRVVDGPGGAVTPVR